MEDRVQEQDRGLYRHALATATKHAYTSADVAGEPMMLAVAHAQRVESMSEEIGRLRTALKAAKEKLTIYRASRSGEYSGGMEYTALMKLIDNALGQR